ncbi:MAG: glycosyltransferase [Chloroflexi bacterium]|nr:MAG: glycosyltransferase [Chloroflexota bacterium]
MRVVILMALTGGGHRSAALAIQEALQQGYGPQVQVEIVDALRGYAPFPFSHLDALYPVWVARGVWSWRWGFRLTCSPRRVVVLLRLLWPLTWPRARRLIQEHPADVLVSVHPLVNHTLIWALRRLKRETPFVTVVTDLVTVHPFWFSPGVTRMLVGSEPARRQVVAWGIPPDRVRVTGLPVSLRFVTLLHEVTRQEARCRLNWLPDCPAVLLVGGGEGMGPLYEIAQAIAHAGAPIQLAVVAGRNERLRWRLEQAHWPIPVHIYGFVHNMPELMRAADLLVTKAGPGTISEACIAGLPMILSGAIPGQEEGNVAYLVEQGAGTWAPSPEQIAHQVLRWTQPGDPTLAQMAERARALGHPEAALEVAREIVEVGRG